MHALANTTTSLQFCPIYKTWLPVNERIKFKILLLTFKALHQEAPTYIQDLVTRYSTSRTLRSSSTLHLQPVNINLKSYGSITFASASSNLEQSTRQHPFMWQLILSTHRHLKTHLLEQLWLLVCLFLFGMLNSFFSLECFIERLKQHWRGTYKN